MLLFFAMMNASLSNLHTLKDPTRLGLGLAPGLAPGKEGCYTGLVANGFALCSVHFWKGFFSGRRCEVFPLSTAADGAQLPREPESTSDSASLVLGGRPSILPLPLQSVSTYATTLTQATAVLTP